MQLLPLSFALALLSQSPAKEADDAALLYRYYASQAADYRLSHDENEQQLELRQQPVLKWLNAENYLGSVFVWTSDGRPEVIGCIGSRQTSAGECFVFHELHSLSLTPLLPLRFGDGKRTWKPPTPGVAMRSLEGAPEPADSEPRRLTQMRNLAREFTGWMKQDGDVTQLRLLPQPILRYQSAKQKVLDGAMFALVWKGTDPEVLLLLESREDQGALRWHYAFARFNWHEMWVQRNDHEIWRVKSTGPNNNDVYISGRVGQTTLSDVGKVLGE